MANEFSYASIPATDGQQQPAKFSYASLTPAPSGDISPVSGVSNATAGGRAVRRGVATTKSLLGEFSQFLGGVFGSETLEALGEDGVRAATVEAINNPSDVSSVDDIDSLATLGTFIVEKVGENLPMLATIIGTAGAGAATGAAIGTTRAAGIGKSLLETAGKQALIKRGAQAGAFVGAEVLGVGEVAGELRSQGFDPADNPFLTLGAGSAVAGLDVVALGAIYKTAFKSIAPEVADSFVRRVARGFGVGALTEMPTEAAQELITIASNKFVDPSYEIFSPANLKRIRDAGIAGGVVGGVLGGGGRAVVEGTERIRDNLNRANIGPVVTEAKNLFDQITPTKKTVKEDQPVPAAGLFDFDVIRTKTADATTRFKEKINTAVAAAASGFSSEELRTTQAAVKAQGQQIRDELSEQLLATKTLAAEKLDLTNMKIDEMLSKLEAYTASLSDTDPSAAAPTNKRIIALKNRFKQAGSDVNADFRDGLNIAADIASGAAKVSKKRAEQLISKLRAMRSQIIRTKKQDIKETVKDIEAGIKTIDDDLLNLPDGPTQPSTTLREPRKVVRAQLEELARGTKRSVLGTEREAQSILRDFVAQSDELVLLDSPEGLVATRRADAEAVQADIEAGRMDAVLGFSGPKPADAGVIVQARNADGVSVSEEVASAESLTDAALNAVTDDVAVKTAQDVLVERADELVDEQSVFWTPVGVRGGARGQTGLNDDGTLTAPKARPYTTREKAAEVAEQMQEASDAKGKTASYDVREVKGGYAVRQVFSDPTERTIQRMVTRIERSGRNIKDQRYVMSVAGKRLNTRLITALGRELNGGTNNTDAFKALNVKGDFLSGLAQLSIEYGLPLPAPRDYQVIAGDVTWGQVKRISERLDLLERQLRSSGVPAERKAAIVTELKNDFGFTLADNFDPAEQETAEPFEEVDKIRPLLEEDTRMPFETAKNESPQQPTQVKNFTSIQGAAAGVQAILESLDIKEKVIIVDEVSGAQVAARLRKREGDAYQRLASIIEGQIKHTEQASIYGGLFDVLNELPEADRYIPVFVRNKETYANQHQALAHELGHVVEMTALYAAPKAIRDEVLASVGGNTREEQLENFATNVAMWAHQAFKDGRIDSNLTGVESFFAGLGRKLVDFWHKFKTIFAGKYSESFRDFMDALHLYSNNGYKSRPASTKVGRDYIKWLRENGSQPYLYDNRKDFLAAENLAQMPTMDEAVADVEGNAFQSYWRRAQDFYKRLRNQPLSAAKGLVYTADAELRGMGANWLADMFWARPGDRSGVAETVFTKINRLIGPLHSDLSKRLSSFGKLDSDLNQQVAKELVRQTPLDNITDQTVKARVASLRRYLDKVYDMYTGQGLKLKKRKNFSPLQLDPLRVEARRTEFLAILAAENYSPQAAESFYQAIVHDKNGGLVETLDDTPDVDFAGPGTPYKQKRKLSQSTRKALEEFWQDDIANVLLTYTDFMARRAAWENRFNLVGMGITAKEAADKGINPKDPIAGLQYELKRRRRFGDITPEQYSRIVDHILPAYAGRLGMDLNPKLRKVMGYTLVYQNYRLLAFSMFSQLVDAGTLMARAGPAGAVNIIDTIKQARTADVKEMARTLGVVRDSVTEHILNEQTLNTYSNSRDKKLNDMLFKYNLMEGWTNTMRTMALVFGREFLLKNRDKALEGNARAKSLLKELDITAEELVGWDGSNPQDNERIAAALHRFVDQSMLRPNPAIRPVWMSDPHYALFAHLKPFLYAYYETFLKRTFSNVVADRTLMPAILLGLFTLPFAALGYELRRKLTGTRSMPMSSGEYLWEITQRTGALGPMQMVLDMETSSSFGKPFIMGLTGPSFEQVYDFMDKDFDSFMAKAIPVANNFGGAREYIREVL